MSIKKTIYLITMTLILCIMTLGYAALQQRVDVEVEASIDSTYRVEITRVQVGTVSGDARSTQVPSYHDLTSTFNVGLTNTSDYITYTIEITNYSTVDIRLNNTEITTTNNNVTYVKSGIRNGDIMLAGSTKTVTIKVKLTEATTEEQTGTITISFDFTRLKGGLGEVASNLPSNYKECEYIESTGTQYIDTGIKATNETVVKAKLYTTETGNKNWFGGSAQTDYNFVFNSWNKNQFEYQYGLSKTWHKSTTTDNIVGEVFTVEFGNGSIKINDNTIDSLPTTVFTDTKTLQIFIRNGNGGRGYIAGRVYYFQIYQGTDLIQELIPTLDDNNVPCFYDTISGETFYNLREGSFLYQLKE